MHALIQGRLVDFSRHMYFGGMEDRGTYEDLYRGSDGKWVLHTRFLATAEEPTLRTLSEDEAVGWLIELRQSKERGDGHGLGRQARPSVPQWVVPYEERFRCGQIQHCGPPPIGQQVDLLLPEGSVTATRLKERQTQVLEPGTVLEHLMRPRAVAVASTAGFRQERHDPLLARLQALLEAQLFERPHIAVIQNRQDHGCDLIADWPLRVKYGVQLKSNGDAEEEDFARSTVQQIQDSRQHGLRKLFVVLAVDITGPPHEWWTPS